MNGELKAPPVVIVTGATGNVGRAISARLAAGGTRVVSAERTAVRCAGETIADIDLGVADSVQAAFVAVALRYGHLDGLVHTVGTFHGGAALLETPSDTFTALFQTNVLGTANALRAALGVMLPAGHGRIAVVASADALVGAAGRSAYAASKGAQLRLVESAAAEVRGRGVQINAVLPGTLDTPENRAAQPDADRGEWVSLDAVAEVLAFLVSPASAAIHGEALRLGRQP